MSDYLDLTDEEDAKLFLATRAGPRQRSSVKPLTLRFCRLSGYDLEATFTLPPLRRPAPYRLPLSAIVTVRLRTADEHPGGVQLVDSPTLERANHPTHCCYTVAAEAKGSREG